MSRRSARQSLIDLDQTAHCAPFHSPDLQSGLQWVMQLSPSTHFVSLSTAILFRNAGLSLVWPDLLALTAIGSVFFGVTLLRFRSSLSS